MAVQSAAPAQRVMRRLAFRRAISALSLVAALGLFLLWIPPASRNVLISNLVSNRLLIVLLLGFTLTALSLLWARGQAFDIGLFKRVNLRGDQPNVWLDRVMWTITQIGSVGMVALVAVIMYAMRERRFALGFVLGSLTLLLMVTIIKALTDRARPFRAMTETRVIGIREPGLSFPSGHTTQTFFMMTLIVAHFEPLWLVSVALLGIALLVGVTRVYLGVHYPRDVIAGAVLGVMWARLAILVAPFL
jgi:membrane-associated phospholipid phosphatase